MFLHPDARKYLDALDTLAPDLQVNFGKDAPEDIPQSHISEDRNIAGVPVRVYSPASTKQASQDQPCLIYFHGGGWAGGTLDMIDATVRALIAHLPIMAISVDYRLAPAHPFPAAVDDAETVARAVLSNQSGLPIDPSRVVIGGDSSGGNIAAVTAQQLRYHTPSFVHQVLIFPVTDLSSTNTTSYRTFGHGYYLDTQDMERFIAQYAHTAERSNPRLSPLKNPDLKGLAPTSIVLAECDVLVDEVRAYAQALLNAGNDVTLAEFMGQIHAFINLGGINADARAARRFINSQLADALNIHALGDHHAH